MEAEASEEGAFRLIALHQLMEKQSGAEYRRQLSRESGVHRISHPL